MRKEYKQVIHSITVKILPAFAGLFFSLYSVVVLSPEEIGRFVIMLVTYNLIRMIAEGGMGLTLVNEKFGLKFLSMAFMHSIVVVFFGAITLYFMYSEYTSEVFILIAALLFSAFSLTKVNRFRIELKYHELSQLILFASLISVTLASLDLYYSGSVRSLALRYLIFEMVITLGNRTTKTKWFKKYSLKEASTVYKSSIVYTGQALIENIRELIFVQGISSQLTNRGVGLYNRTAQFSDGLVKMPWSAFRPLYISVENSSNVKTYTRLFTALIMSGFFVLMFSANLIEASALQFLDRTWEGMSFWIRLNAFLALSFVIEQASITRLYSSMSRLKVLLYEAIFKSSIFIVYFLGFSKLSLVIWSIAYFIYAIGLLIVLKKRLK